MKKTLLFLLLNFFVFHPSHAASLTEDEQEVLNQGEISTGEYVAGGVVGTFVGLGIGNAIQGRYIPKGLIFTLGEVVGATVIMVGAIDCIDSTLTTLSTNTCKKSTTTGVGLAILLGFRIWEIIDVWSGPPAHNRMIKRLREKAGLPPAAPHASLAPVIDPQGSLKGAQLSLKFEF